MNILCGPVAGLILATQVPAGTPSLAEATTDAIRANGMAAVAALSYELRESLKGRSPPGLVPRAGVEPATFPFTID